MTRYDAEQQKYFHTNPGFGLGVTVRYRIMMWLSPHKSECLQYVTCSDEIWVQVKREEYGVNSILEKPILDKTYGASGKVSRTSCFDINIEEFWFIKILVLNQKHCMYIKFVSGVPLCLWEYLWKYNVI